jgi:RNA polymerase sigma-70 factor (family 1)
MKIVHPHDEGLNLRFKNGDVKAFKLLYENSKGMLYKNIFKFIKEEETSADILQEVYVEIWNNRESFDISKPFHHLLYQIAKHKIYDFFRKSSRDLKLREKLIAQYQNHVYRHTEDDYILTEDIKLLKAEIDRLPEKCGEVFKLCKIEGKSYQEVAELLKISTATVNNHIVKATKILKQNINKDSSITKLAFFLLFLISE